MNKTKTLKQKAIIATSFVFAWLFIATPIVNASSQSFYDLSGTPKQGMLMSLTSNPGVIEEASNKNTASLVGVVAPLDGTSLNQLPGQISVRTNGEASALVSTMGGNILVGDKITASSLLGVGKKANGSGWIIGTAQASLDSSSKNAVKTVLKDSKGNEHTYYVAAIPILVSVSYYSAPANAYQSVVPDSLQAALDKIAKKHVSLETLIISTILLFVGLYLAGSVVKSAVRGGLIAISRQPLTKKLIYRNMLQAFIMAVLICILALLCSWVVLRFA